MASSKNYTEVLIGGKVFTLSGFESEEYLQKVSTYLNHKIDECSSSEGYRKQSAETRSVLLALNIADDYFKARKQGGTLESDIEAKDKEMYDLKHELISVQIKLENARKSSSIRSIECSRALRTTLRKLQRHSGVLPRITACPALPEKLDSPEKAFTARFRDSVLRNFQPFSKLSVP